MGFVKEIQKGCERMFNHFSQPSLTDTLQTFFPLQKMEEGVVFKEKENHRHNEKGEDGRCFSRDNYTLH